MYKIIYYDYLFRYTPREKRKDDHAMHSAGYPNETFHHED